MVTDTIAPSITPDAAPPVVETPAVETATETPAPAESIADHAEQFTPKREYPREEETGRFTQPQKHRAQSQKAGADDVPEINRLTKELRTKEAELVKHRPEAGSESPRLRALKRQIKAIESELGELSPASTPAQRSQPSPAVTPAPAAPRQASSPAASTFTDKEPTLDDFASADDPYREYMRALAKYDRNKEAWEAKQTEAQTREQAQVQEAQTQKAGAWVQRVTAFSKAKADFGTVTRDLMQQTLPPLLLEAIVTDDKGPDFVYYLAQHPDIAENLMFDADQKAVSAINVATLQRRLLQHVQAASTGSAAVAKHHTPPKPPNPVGTGPVQSDDDPPGEASSIADHAKYYRKRR